MPDNATSGDTMIRNFFTNGGGPSDGADNSAAAVRSNAILEDAVDEATSEETADPQPKVVDVDTPEEEDYDGEEDEADDADPEPEDQFFYEGPTSKYRTAEDARQGISEKDRYIEQLRRENEALLMQTAEVEQLRAMVSDDIVEQQAINQKLPEKYRGKSVDDFETNDEKLEYVRALARAEAEHAAEKGLREAEAKTRQQELRQKAEQANEFLSKEISYESFSATNPEDRNALALFLDEKIGGGETTRLNAAQEVHLAFGPELARAFVEGLRIEFARNRGRSVGSIIEKVKTKPVRTATRGNPTTRTAEPEKKSSEQVIKSMYANNAQARGRRRR